MAKDLHHEALKTALEKDGWVILKENYPLEVDDEIIYFIDTFAEKYIIAQREKQWIVVEVKSFNKVSKTYEFHSAIG
ncbi:MAG: element excision factor XisH family protein [Bacteroidota bacterium]